VELEEVEPCDPSADFAFAPGQADAALLAAKNAITAAILKYRLDTGSPPFFQTGTCRAARIAERAGR
jgi:hypothetical protein